MEFCRIRSINLEESSSSIVRFTEDGRRRFSTGERIFLFFHVCLLFDTVQNRRCSVRVVGGGIDHYNTIPVLLFC